MQVEQADLAKQKVFEWYRWKDCYVVEEELLSSGPLTHLIYGAFSDRPGEPFFFLCTQNVKSFLKSKKYRIFLIHF